MKSIMKSIVVLSLCLFVSGEIFSGCTPAGDTPEEMIAAARALDDRFAEAYSKADVDAMMECYWNDPEVVLFDPGGMRTIGWENIRASMIETFAAAPGGKLELTERNDKIAGDVVIGWGLWSFTMITPDGSPFIMEGRYTDVKAKRDGKWVYIIDHASVPLPPEPPGM